MDERERKSLCNSSFRILNIRMRQRNVLETLIELSLAGGDAQEYYNELLHCKWTEI